MAFAVEFSSGAERDFVSLPERDKVRIAKAIYRMSDDPRRASNVKKLTGDNRYRLRVGDWRILYEVQDERSVVLVLKVGHRREVYRRR